jgi:mannose-6-phosphate isomerase-like protein (cupin superfamily)
VPDGVRLLLSGDGNSRKRPLPHGRRQAPGGWNRAHLEVTSLAWIYEANRGRSVREALDAAHRVFQEFLAMRPYFFSLAGARKVPVDEGRVISHRLVTHLDSGSGRLGFHITQGQPDIAGTGTVYPDKDEIIYVLEGSIAVTFGGDQRFLKPGEGVLIPAGLTYDWQAGPEGWTIATIFSPPLE